MRPSELIKILAVPGTNEPLQLVVSDLAGDEPYNGWLGDDTGRIWARLDAFRFAFVKFPPITEYERLRVATGQIGQVRVPETRFVGPFDPRIEWLGERFSIRDYLQGFHGHDENARFSFRSTAPKIDLALHAHGWSGITLVSVNGQPVTEINLFNRENAIVRTVTIENPERHECVILVSPTGRAHPEAQGRQLILEGIIEYSDTIITPVYSKPTPRNRGGDFRPRFFEIIRDIAPNGIILDLGGGKRQIEDSRYLNLEYSKFEEPDLFGDGTNLPFRNETIDFVYTAAVLEHVRDPLRVGEEVYRVLKKGGRVLANAAFMQPIHSEGQHFFNVTPYGIDLIFERFANRSVWWEVGFLYTINWLIEVAGVIGIVEQAKLDQFVALADEIEQFISYPRGMYIASGVWIEGVK
jgi:SAM-dependent methyltransferase